MVPFLELFLCMPLSVTVTIFQGYSNVRPFQVKIVRSCPIKLKLCSVVKFVVYIMNVPLYSLSHLFKGATINWHVSDLTKSLMLAFSQ